MGRLQGADVSSRLGGAPSQEAGTQGQPACGRGPRGRSWTWVEGTLHAQVEVSSRESGTGADASRGPGLHYSEETQAVIPQPGWDHLRGQEAILSLTQVRGGP